MWMLGQRDVACPPASGDAPLLKEARRCWGSRRVSESGPIGHRLSKRPARGSCGHVLFKLAEHTHLLLQKERVYRARKGTASWEADRRRLASPWASRPLSAPACTRLHTWTRTGPHATSGVIVLPRKQAKLQYGNQNDSPSRHPGSLQAPHQPPFPRVAGARLSADHTGSAPPRWALPAQPPRADIPTPVLLLPGCSPPGSPDAEIPSPNFVDRFHGVAEFYTVLCHCTFVNIPGVIDAKRISEMKTHPTNKTKSVIKIKMKRSNSLA